MGMTVEDRRRIGGSGATMEPLAVPIPEAQRISGMSRTAVYNELNRGNLKAVKAGIKTLILVDSIRSYLASLPAAEFGSSKAA